MGWIKQYIVSIVAAAIVCSIIKTLSEGNNTSSFVIKLLSGLFMALAVISPIVKLELDNISEYINNYQIQGENAVHAGIEYSQTEAAAIIKANTQAYILDKAQKLGAEIEVEVQLDGKSPPIPCAVTLKGHVSPFVKQRLTQYIYDDLGIAEENQTWI